MVYKLGDLVEQVTETNFDLKYGLDDIVGVTIEKEMIPTIANLTQTNLAKFIVVKPYDFIYNPRTHGKKIGLGYNTTNRCYITTWNNNVFRVKESMKNIVLPDYLYMHFKRDRWDKEACFNAWGSSTVVLLWSSFCEMKINLPSIEEQKKIVYKYNVITDRIELLNNINDNLQQQAFSLYKHMIADTDKNAILSDIANITMGTSPKGETINTEREGIVFYQGKTDFGFRFPTVRQFTTEPKRYAQSKDILMSVRAPVGPVNIANEKCAIGRGLAAISPKDGCYSYLYYTMIELNFELNKFNDEGTVFGSITKDDLHDLAIVNIDDIKKSIFEKKVSAIDEFIQTNEFEISKLIEMSSLLLSRLAS